MSAAAYFGGSSDPAYWVSGTSYAQGKIIRSPSDHQLYTRIVAGAGATDPSADATNWRPEGMRAIKSIQRGTLSFSGTNNAATATISSVNPAKTELRFLGANPLTSSSVSEGMVYIVLTNSTTITAARQSGGNSNNPIVSWELTEYF
jgi:hypothetical protein